LVLAGLSGAMAVASGAYAAHGLANSPQALQWVDLASRYQMYHALALAAVALLQRPGARLAPIAGTLFALGTVLFCGGLYAHALFDMSPGPLVPFGGTAFILGWLVLATSAAVKSRPPE
jgi:uncharacterized membrane protein YgdD (TMEM256/DUF423 family)